MRSRLWNLVKRLLFRLDAETAHRYGVFFVKLLGSLSPRLLARVLGSFDLASPRSKRLATRIAGVDFAHPLGLAAGFDKNGELLPFAEALGFAFIEVGTVTPRAQSGNEKPRLFRDSKRSALFNRMGFNNEGADVVEKRLRVFRKKTSLLRVGVNIGKNKDTPNELAAQDYALLAHRFAALADYLVINVSSPNTPGLRDLQSLKNLEPIIQGVLAAVHASDRPDCAVFLKLAPEVHGEALKDILQAAEAWGISGFVLTNTLGGEYRGLTGGWSGGPLKTLAAKSLEYARYATALPIISVGGILTPEEAAQRLKSGAQLVQIYTGWIYRGPAFPGEIVRYLTAR
ncbi:MAG: quinone-dependent dihydroorotate dehydrogenase [Bdellovibrionota bacterium]